MGGIHMMQATLAAMTQIITAAPRFDLPNLMISTRGRRMQHRSPGTRAHRTWKRRRAAGRG